MFKDDIKPHIIIVVNKHNTRIEQYTVYITRIKFSQHTESPAVYMARLNKFHEGSCGPCRLCMEPAKKYTHVDKLSEDEYAFLLEVESTSIDQSACICYSCSKQIKRNTNNLNFQPRWKPKIVRETLKCSIK